MELLVLVGILFALFIAEIIYYRIHALENLHLKVEFSKDVAQFGEDIELVEIAEKDSLCPSSFLSSKHRARSSSTTWKIHQRQTCSTARTCSP